MGADCTCARPNSRSEAHSQRATANCTTEVRAGDGRRAAGLDRHAAGPEAIYGAPSVRATTPIHHAAIAPTEKYSYCIAVGGPRRSTEQHAYVSQVFVLRGVNTEYAFGAFVRSVHPQDAFGTIRCSYPQP